MDLIVQCVWEPFSGNCHLMPIHHLVRVSSPEALEVGCRGGGWEGGGYDGSQVCLVLCHLPWSLWAGMKGRPVLAALPFPAPSSLPGQALLGGATGTRSPICGFYSLVWEKCQLSHPLQLLPGCWLPQLIIPSLLPGPGTQESVRISK